MRILFPFVFYTNHLITRQAVRFEGHYLLQFGFDKKMTHLGALTLQKRGGYCWFNYNQINYYGAILTNFLAIAVSTLLLSFLDLNDNKIGCVLIYDNSRCEYTIICIQS